MRSGFYPFLLTLAAFTAIGVLAVTAGIATEEDRSGGSFSAAEHYWVFVALFFAAGLVPAALAVVMTRGRTAAARGASTVLYSVCWIIGLVGGFVAYLAVVWARTPPSDCA